MPSFDQPIGSWTTTSLINTIFMFRQADVFDQDISGWDITNVWRFTGMFENAINFNQNLNSWKILSSGAQMSRMLMRLQVLMEIFRVGISQILM